MLWLLPYVGWTLAASAVASVAGYAAVTQFSVVQRVLAMALDRALRKLATSEDGKPTYTLEHTGTGNAQRRTWAIPQLNVIIHCTVKFAGLLFL